MKELLLMDLSRQYRANGNSDMEPNILGVFTHVFSPRFAPVVIFRLSHWCFLHRLSPFAKLLSLFNFIFFGLEIAVKCEIGGGLYFPHTQGTVIGASSIGTNATIYHNVTFGALEIDLNYNASARPIVGNNVIIGSGAKILGGITLSDNVRVGANAVVLADVPSGATVAGIPARIVKISEKS